jgi:hypothetical protein
MSTVYAGAMAGYAGPPARLELYERVVATIDAVDRKGATMPYTSRNGHMFSFLDPTGSMALRLSSGDRDAFLTMYGTTLVEQHGRVIQEYVVVPDDLLERTDELAGWFARSHDWIGTLKPKPTKR